LRAVVIMIRAARQSAALGGGLMSAVAGPFLALKLRRAYL
jgi:hypothetical protein